MIDEQGLKFCPRCEQKKLPAGNFYKVSRNTGDGYSGYCILCTKAKAINWHEDLSADKRINKNKRDWEQRKISPEYRAKQSVRQKEWRTKNRDRILQTTNEYKKAHKKRYPEKHRIQTAIWNNKKRAKRYGVRDDFSYLDWVECLQRFENKCAFCGATDCLFDLEHITPISHGGNHAVGNIVPACRPCNAQKSRKSIEQFCTEREISPEQLQKIRTIAAGS